MVSTSVLLPPVLPNLLPRKRSVDSAPVTAGQSTCTLARKDSCASIAHRKSPMPWCEQGRCTPSDLRKHVDLRKRGSSTAQPGAFRCSSAQYNAPPCSPTAPNRSPKRSTTLAAYRRPGRGRRASHIGDPEPLTTDLQSVVRTPGDLRKLRREPLPRRAFAACVSLRPCRAEENATFHRERR